MHAMMESSAGCGFRSPDSSAIRHLIDVSWVGGLGDKYGVEGKTFNLNSKDWGYTDGWCRKKATGWALERNKPK